MAYLCWADHHENLDDRVRQAVADEHQVIAFLEAARGGAPGPDWRVAVECTGKHANVFAGRGTIPQPVEPPDVLGQNPTASDLLLQKAAATLSLTDSLARVEATAKYFIGLVSTISLLTTAFGAWAATATADPLLARCTAVLAAASIVCGMLAVTPRVATVSVANLASVQAALAGSLKSRARYVQASGVLLALALLCAAFVKRG
jgi:hypothetical protein